VPWTKCFVLDEPLNYYHFEIHTFVIVEGQVPDFKLPFEAELGPMITSEAMHAYVVLKKARPGFPDAWKNNHPVSNNDFLECTP